MNTKKELIEQLGNIFGTSFVSLKNYTASSGEVANHLINVGASYKNAVLKDIVKLEQAKYEDPIMEEARLKMLDSFMKNLNTETASNQSIAQHDAYLKVNDSVKLHIESGTLYIEGMACSKKVLVEVEKKVVKSGAAVLAKNKITKELNLSTTKWRKFKFENVNIVKTSGAEFVLNSANGVLNSEIGE